MNLYQLRYFSLLAKTGHFRKTAEQLCIAQPSLSHSISLLEQELGGTLFEKQGRRSVLTPKGSQFLKYVEKSLDVLDEEILNMRHIAMGAGVIELGFLRTLGVGFLPEMAHRFLEEQKEKTIQFKFLQDFPNLLTGCIFIFLTGHKPRHQVLLYRHVRKQCIILK